MRTLSNVFQLGLKELRSLYRDPALLVLIVYAFTLAIYTAATALPEAPHRATLGVVDEDQSQASRRNSMPSSCPISCHRCPSTCGRWTVVWTRACTPSR